VLQIGVHHQDVGLGAVIFADPCQRHLAKLDADTAIRRIVRRQGVVQSCVKLSAIR
jgi:hypothetical protein